MELNELIKDCARRQKKGLHFILTSILIWAMICAVHLTDMPIDTKNLITFCCSAVLFPLAWMLSKVLKIDFEAVPEKMVMVYAMVFGAHLMPFSWLYDSRSYMVFSIVVPILSLIVGLIYPPVVLAALMIVIEAVFSACLFQECKKLR